MENTASYTELIDSKAKMIEYMMKIRPNQHGIDALELKND